MNGGRGRHGRRRAGRRSSRRPVRRSQGQRALRAGCGRRQRGPRRIASPWTASSSADGCPAIRTPGRRRSTSREVEPDSVTVGRTTVAAFQVGRRFSGAADNIGFAVSSDDGSTWRSGLLPGLTRVSVPAGPNERASDPVVAYDEVNRVWLIATLALEGQMTRLTVSRSTDGLTWSAPVTAIEALRGERDRLRQELDRVRQRAVQPQSAAAATSSTPTRCEPTGSRPSAPPTEARPGQRRWGSR